MATKPIKRNGKKKPYPKWVAARHLSAQDTWNLKRIWDICERGDYSSAYKWAITCSKEIQEQIPSALWRKMGGADRPKHRSTFWDLPDKKKHEIYDRERPQRFKNMTRHQLYTSIVFDWTTAVEIIRDRFAPKIGKLTPSEMHDIFNIAMSGDNGFDEKVEILDRAFDEVAAVFKLAHATWLRFGKNGKRL